MDSILDVLYGMLQDELAGAIAAHDLDAIEQVLTIAGMANLELFPEQQTAYMSVEDAREFLDELLDLEAERDE